MSKSLVSLLIIILTACGETPERQDGRGDLRIIAVTHGQSADPFWSIVANGMQDAAADLGVRVEYQAPTSFDMVRMSQLIEAAAAARPSALLVSVPDADALAGALRKAKAAGIPMLSINSGDAHWQALGMLAHVGQTEYEAAHAAGERLAEAGARRVLCVNHEVGNLALDERCRGLADALRRAGGSTTVLGVALADPDDAEQRIGNALAANLQMDGVLTLGPGGAVPALAALRKADRDRPIHFGTFDLGTEILQTIQAGEMLFAIDQQPYLQGYLGVMLLVKYLETGAIAGGEQVIRTGPGFVTRENAAQVQELAERGIR